MGVESQKIKVLVVEDNEDSRLLMDHILKAEGFSVESACNGAEAVTKALAGSYDVVLMDHEMPVKDGIQATKDLRAAGYQKPIIALTAHTIKEKVDVYTSSGFSGYVTKPVDFKQLFQLLRQVKG